MPSPVNTTDAATIHRLLREIEARADQINQMEGIKDNTDEEVHTWLFKLRQACKEIGDRVGTGNA